jgi:hypothetical protein
MGKGCRTYGEKKNAYVLLVRKPEGRDYLEGIGVDGRITLRCIVKKNIMLGCELP